jgi:hypothetical protein
MRSFYKETSNSQDIHVGAKEAVNGFIGRANDGFIFIETGI